MNNGNLDKLVCPEFWARWKIIQNTLHLFKDKVDLKISQPIFCFIMPRISAHEWIGKTMLSQRRHTDSTGKGFRKFERLLRS